MVQTDIEVKKGKQKQQSGLNNLNKIRNWKQEEPETPKPEDRSSWNGTS